MNADSIGSPFLDDHERVADVEICRLTLVREDARSACVGRIVSRACVNGLVFGGHLEPFPSWPRDLRSGSRFLDEHVRFADVELRHVTLTSKRIR